MITSSSNPKLRYVRRLAHRAFRRREGRLVAEGVRLVGDALDAGVVPAFTLVADLLHDTERGRDLRLRLDALDAPVLDVDPALLDELADTVTPQGVLAVLPVPALPLPADLRLVLVTDSVRDPGNVGTMLRTALAAGADAVIAAPGTADVTAPKVVRAGMGAHFRLPILEMAWDEIRPALAEAGLSVWVADGSGDTAYTDVDWRQPSALVVGGEAEGPSQDAMALGPAVRIPMPGPAESLNAAVASAVFLFEAARQRSAGGSRTE